jgi:2-polyprenyl-6-methoxyphenol hydroxylase-like FAD-dependent oxidoreductase
MIENIHGTMKNRNILISGAGIAGLTLAYWLRRHHFHPVVVESAPALRDAGYKVDIRGAAVQVIERMGLLLDVSKSTTNMRKAYFVNRSGRRLATMDAALFGGRDRGDIEILRGDLVRILYQAIHQDVEVRFNDSITSISQNKGGVDVEFRHGQKHTFALVIGADGLHSNVRALAFGDESRFIRKLNHYISIFTAPNHLELDRLEILYATPGKTVNVYSTGKDSNAQVYLMFAAKSLKYDHRDVDLQKKIVTETFRGTGWDVPFLLDQLARAPDFYFDAISQVYMDCWTNERVALLGDAGYCASPASGQGTSVALVGAYVLAGELLAAGGDHETAFFNYERTVWDFAMQNQQLAESNLQGMVLKSKAQIWFQMQMIRLLPHLPGRNRIIGRVTDAIHRAATSIQIRDYS